MNEQSNEPKVWQNLPNSEERLQQLRDRDIEISKLAIGLQMRTRITALENQNAMFRNMEKTWKISKLKKATLSISNLMRRVIKRFG
jgi:hypothetical protein